MCYFLLFVRFLFTIHGMDEVKCRLRNDEYQIQDSTFQFWLRDTIPIIRSNSDIEKRNNVGLKSIDLIVGQDSLTFEVLRKFELEIRTNPLSIKTGYIKKVIDLLEEYKELPKGKFRLSFLVSNYYYPSTVKEVIYENLFEIRDLEIIELSSGNKSIYNYIRGRINDKTITKKVNGKEITRYYDFIWDNNKLIKKERF